MANDAFYRMMSDNELHAMYKEIEKNIEFDASQGMIREKELILGVAKERGLELGNRFDAVKGYVEFGMKSDKE